VMIVPIRVRGLSLGAMTFGTGQGRRGYRPSDVAAAEDLAGRVGVAIERVLLHRETQKAVVATARHAAQLRRPMGAGLAVHAQLPDADGNSRGLIVLADKHDQHFTEDDEAILVSLAQMASVALENARLYEAVQTNEDRLQALVDASPLAILELDLQGGLQRWN